MKLFRGKSRAFTLIEVMLAIMIISTAMTGVLMTFTKSTALISQTEEIVLATSILQEQVERIRLRAYDNIISTYYPSGTFNSTLFSDLNNPVGTIALDYPYGSGYPNNRIVRVVVTLNWTSNGGRAMAKSMVSLITDGGINKQ